MEDCWACSECGMLQAESPKCRRCGTEDLVDVRSASAREFLRDADLRRRDRASARHRMIGVVVGMATVFACWLIPGFWTVRRQFFALPVFADQIGAMVLVGLGVLKLLDARVARTRFPWLEQLPPAARH